MAWSCRDTSTATLFGSRGVGHPPVHGEGPRDVEREGVLEVVEREVQLPVWNSSA